jgi:hypothetical protein
VHQGAARDTECWPLAGTRSGSSCTSWPRPVWVGGQITLAALVPVLRRLGAEIPRAAARRFNQVAWPAFAVLILTGVWNVIAVRS